MPASLSLINGSLFISGKAAGDAAHAEMSLIRADAKLHASAYSTNIAEMSSLLELAASTHDDRCELKLSKLFRNLSELEDDSLPLAARSPEAEETARGLRYLRALRRMMKQVSPKSKLGPELLLDMHSRCLTNSGHHQTGLMFRQSSDTIPSKTPLGTFSVPDPDQVFPLLLSLCGFINKNVYSPVTQTAIAYCHYERVKPFEVDDRYTTLMLCHAIFARRGLLHMTIAPLSLFASINPTAFEKHYDLQNIEAEDGSEDAQLEETELIQRLNGWISSYANSIELAAASMNALCDTIEALQQHWHQQLGRYSKGSLLEELLPLLSSHPIVTVESIMTLTGRSFSTTNDAIARLVEAGVLSLAPHTHHRTRVFRADDAFRAYETMLENLLPRFLLNAAFRTQLLN